LAKGLRSGDVLRSTPSMPGEKPQFFRIDFEAEAHCRIWGDDLWMTAFVPIAHFFTGGHVSIPTPRGTQKIFIPADTAQKSSLTIKGMGLPATQTAPEGDLIVRLEVQKGSEFHSYGLDMPKSAGAKLHRFQNAWLSQ